MKNLCLIFTALLTTICLNALMPREWSDFQRDLGIQAASFKDSPEHLEMRSRATLSYNVGDTHTFWRWNLAVMPPTWIQPPSTCRAVGAHSYIFVADSEWNVHINQANVDSILVRLEDRTVNDPDQGAIEMDISLFGPVPDVLDNDPRLIVFYSALGSFQGTSFDGYFSPYNQVTEAQAQQMNPPGHSNECEMIYMTCSPLSPVAPIRLSVLAHELQHLIHWGQDANEETWLNEGCAELAMVAYGIPDPISGFPSAPDNNLTAWNQTFADYVKVMLFFTYLQEHYDDTGLISALVADPVNGVNSLSQLALDHYPQTGFEGIFRNWNIANIIDADPPQNPLWGYAQLDLPNFSMTNLSPAPNLVNQNIQAYSADYLKLISLAAGERQVTISTDNPVYLSVAKFSLSGVCLGVDSLGFGTQFEVITPLSSEAANIVFVLSNPSALAISYSVNGSVYADDPSSPCVVTALRGNQPNPFVSATSISYSVRESGSVRLEIYNSRGQKIRGLVNSSLIAGTHKVDWDGLDEAGNPVGDGVYIVRLRSGNDSKSIRVLKLANR